MKDRVFIAWSGSHDVAERVKELLETQHNYICAIGGNSDNDSHFSSVGDTVLQQIKSCNQAIVIFQNRADNTLSSNLLFELGYCLATYSNPKVHCVKRAGEDVKMPSDFDNSFVEPIEDEWDDARFADGVVAYFISRQKMDVNENKMNLINNRYQTHERIVSHYSENGSRCSDYELAQYVLFYMQAAHLYGDEERVFEELSQFKSKHHYAFSHELSLSVNIALSYFEMVNNIQSDADAEVYLGMDAFWKFRNDYKHYLTQNEANDNVVFDEWISIFLNEHLNFAYMLFGNNQSLDDDTRKQAYLKSREFGHITLACIEQLETISPCKQNNDSKGLLSLLRAYVFRNIYIANEYLGDEEPYQWLKKTMNERASLKKTFERSAIDTQIYNTFCMEYYLSLISYLPYAQDVSDFEIGMYKHEMKEFLDSIKQKNKINAYLRKIANWCGYDDNG